MGMIFISEDACGPLAADLEKEGHEIFRVKKTDLVAPPVAAHPDIYMCQVKSTLVIDDAVFTEPDIRSSYDEAMARKLGDVSDTPMIPAVQSASGGYIVMENGNIGHDYPYDAAYDAVSTGKYFIHNFECTSQRLIDRARDTGLEFINVKQGYTKCSCAVVGDQAVITADGGIIHSIEAYNSILEDEGQPEEKIDVLKIETGHVRLPGCKYGFIGGASGLVDGVLYFNGDLTEHPDAEKIIDFANRHGVHVKYYEGEPLTDIGSIVYFA